MKLVCLFSFLYLAFLANGTQSQPVYRWVDEDGKIHFSDRPPADAEHEEISNRVQTLNIDESSDELKKVQKIFAPETPEEKRLKQQREQTQQQQRLARQQECEKARELLSVIAEGRFYLVDEEGNEFDVSKEEAQQKRDEVQQFIRDNC